MDVRNYTDDPRLRPILEYLDPTLPDIERMLILAIAAGYTSKQFESLPGLSNRSRNREALRSLEQRGRIQWQRRKGWALVPWPAVEFRHIKRRIRTSKKLRKALDLFADPLGPLRARGLGRLAEMLGPALCQALTSVLRTVDNTMPHDKEVRKRRRLSVLAFVERRLPSEYLATQGDLTSPPPAPADLLEATVSRLADTGAVLSGTRRKDVARLYRLLAGNEEALAHWWQILVALRAAGERGNSLWNGWRHRLDSYLLRRRIGVPADLRVRGISPRKLKAIYPVPDCGYGVWVEDELRLYRRFQSRYRLAFGPFTHDLWVRSHHAVAAGLRADFPGAQPHAIGQDLYADFLFHEADRLSGLPREVIRRLATGKRSRETRRLRAAAEREWVEMPVRLAIAKAAREAGRTDRTDDQLGWAFELLRLAAEREAGSLTDPQRFEELANHSRAVGRGGLRTRRVDLGEQMLRSLVIELESRPATLAPGEPFPVRAIQAPVERTLHRVLQLEWATPEEKRAAVGTIETFVRRRARMHVVFSGGQFENTSISVATGLVEDPAAGREILRLFDDARRQLAA